MLMLFPLFRFAVSEGEAAGALVGVVTAIDIDSGSFGQVAYALAGPGVSR